MKPRIGIALGDVTGIAPEVTVKALARESPKGEAVYSVIGSMAVLHDWNTRLGLNVPFDPDAPVDSTRVRVFDSGALNAPATIKPGAPEAANAAITWLKEAGELCLGRKLDAMVTAPVNKESIIKAGHSFVGQTEFLSDLAKAKRTAMMLLGSDDRGRWLRVALATTHVPIKAVPENLTREKIELAIELAAKACHDLKLPRARVAVCGLNPHAGEGGKMGTEEITTIAPAVDACKKRGINAVGPMSADALFHYAFRGDYDAVVAMYHDQGLVPLKMIGFESGVNWTLGLPFIRTSPDHGTAYDIAGKGIANASSMVAAMRLAIQLTVNR
jgi:4-hydroxythreonine-4-phosphate dehydrogenase